MMVRSRTIIATPPGMTIKEQLVDRGMSQKDFAARMDMSEKHISKLINGEVQLTPDMAVRLEIVLGVPARFWNKLESIYREKIAKANMENDMDEDIELAKKLPYNEMAKNEWVPKATKPVEKVANLRKFFEVVKLSLVHTNLSPAIVCRRMAETEKADYALIAWAQKAKLEARHITTQPINIKALLSSLDTIRAMTRQKPDIFCPELINLLATCGIALVFLPHVGGSFLHGATFCDSNKIVIGLTVRGKDADKFWFSLFHELGHIVLGHINQADGTTEEDEKAADEFARNVLIPEKEFTAFVSNDDFSKGSMLRFAEAIGIDVGIIVGRLQKEEIIQYNWHNDLKTRYELRASDNS